MTAMALANLGKIDLFYNFSLRKTYKIVVFFLNDSLKKSLTAHFVLTKGRKFEVTPSLGRSYLFSKCSQKCMINNFIFCSALLCAH